MSEDGWELACIPCAGKGYEEKLSCGCTGYRMKRSCRSCEGKGIVNAVTHRIQVEEQRKFFECTEDFTKNKQEYLG